jgi:hypothetical protein
MPGITRASQSYLKVHYELRPAKQVERRILVDALLALSTAGFPIPDYHYTGMGSIYFIDFMLLHRLLGIHEMLSVEYDPKIKRRVEFNKPFDCVRTKIAPIGDVIPSLSKDHKHMLWLDYDDILTESHLADVSTATATLSVGSILLITIDVEPPTDTDEPKDWFDYFQEQAGDYFNPALQLIDFSKSKLPRRSVDFIFGAIKSGLSGRTGVGFIPMFNFLYEDGHQMLTLGGMIGTNVEKRLITSSGLNDKYYFRRSFKTAPCKITVPRLTRKERQYLDEFMPSQPAWKPKMFELSAANVKAYRQIYRFCPTYAELLL